MWILIRKNLILAACLLFAVTSISFAQPANKAKERISMMKKMKLLEILNLDEAQADKFITQYTSWEKKMEEQRNAVDKASQDLGKSIKGDASNDEISKKSDVLIETQTKLQGIYFDKLKAMKSILNTKEYGKYLVFEDRFMKELQRILFKRGMEMKKDGEGRGHHDDGGE
ncbi:MAG: hypothetical protein ABSG15_15675 [FCB group bacterium]|jgi:hypothetical protein